MYHIEYNDNGIDLSGIHKRLYNMATTIADILEVNNIPYMLGYGTLLGAVRHQGFVPWDDDFDIFLFEDTYDIACEKLRKGSKGKRWFLEDKNTEPLYFHGWAHVKDLDSQVIGLLYTQDNAYKHQGVHIDLYRTHEINENNIPDYLADEYLNYINRRKNNDLISEDEYAERLLKIAEIRKNRTEYETKDNKKVLTMDGPYKCKKMLFDDIFPLKKFKFIDREFYGPCNADAILTAIYGDYMTPPDISERHPKCKYAEIRGGTDE